MSLSFKTAAPIVGTVGGGILGSVIPGFGTALGATLGGLGGNLIGNLFDSNDDNAGIYRAQQDQLAALRKAGSAYGARRGEVDQQLDQGIRQQLGAFQPLSGVMASLYGGGASRAAAAGPQGGTVAAPPMPTGRPGYGGYGAPPGPYDTRTAPMHPMGPSAILGVGPTDTIRPTHPRDMDRLAIIQALGGGPAPGNVGPVPGPGGGSLKLPSDYLRRM